MRVYNFSPGPAMLPLEVLEQAQHDMLDYNGTGMSVMEMSHRSKGYDDIIQSSYESLSCLLNLSNDYKILYYQGGASQQFAMIPMNLMHTGKADYAVTGSFAKKAAQEAVLYGNVKYASDSKDRNYAYIPEIKKENVRSDASYLHICSNNTIFGTSYRNKFPNIGNIPLIVDMSSNILSEVMDINKCGLIYAGAQKNIGPAGLTLVIARKDLLEKTAIENTPTMLRYSTFAKNDSMYNTPPTYSIYIAGLVFKYLEKIGGIVEIQKINEYKANLLYNALDESQLFSATADKEYRSIMNVTFVSPDAQTDAEFVQQAEKKGLVNLKGHRSIGGMRASIYNAMPVEGVEILAAFIREFEQKYKN